MGICGEWLLLSSSSHAAEALLAPAEDEDGAYCSTREGTGGQEQLGSTTTNSADAFPRKLTKIRCKTGADAMAPKPRKSSIWVADGGKTASARAVSETLASRLEVCYVEPALEDKATSLVWASRPHGGLCRSFLCRPVPVALLRKASFDAGRL